MQRMVVKMAILHKQQVFADKYLETGNGTQSAIDAGYAAGSAGPTASRLLRDSNVRKYIDDVIDKSDTKRIASRDEVRAFLTATMRGETKDSIGLPADTPDRVKSAELLGKTYGLFVDKTVTATVDIAGAIAQARERAIKGSRDKYIADDKNRG